MVQKKRVKREVSTHAIDTMRKIRILSTVIDLKIEHLITAEQCKEFFEKVRDKELLVSIRAGGYCQDITLQKMFERYKIK